MTGKRGNVTQGEQQRFVVKWVGVVVLAIVGLIFCGMKWMPQYRVYSQRMEGEALLAHSVAAKEVAVAEAKAKMESATLLAEAEVIRARGVATANKIIGDSLKDNESYLRYLWVNNLEHSSNAVIYVPTEAGMPIMEAGRRLK